MISGDQRKSRTEPGVRVRTYRCEGALGHHATRCFVTILADTLDRLAMDQVRLCLTLGSVTGLVPTVQERERLHALREERQDIAREQSGVAALIGDRLLSPTAARAALEGPGSTP